jgi:ABC-2 type transport system ATP-binding protein
MNDALVIQGLAKTYPNGVAALKGIDLTVAEGDFFALLGPNGAGKSTAIGIICSLVNKTGGTVRVFGHDIAQDFPAAKACLGVVPQEFNFNIFEPVEEILINQAGYYGIPRRIARTRAERYLRILELWGQRRQQARALSGGMKRRLMIARALIHEPRLLILDEPTAGVDIEIRRSMWDFLRELNRAGTTIILTTHYLEEAEQMCRHIAIIDQGRIVAHDAMKTLIARLSRQVLVLDLAQPLTEAPELRGYSVQLDDPCTLEVECGGDASVNALFAALAGRGIEVKSLRNKQNRLEELFLKLIKNHAAGPAT